MFSRINILDYLLGAIIGREILERKQLRYSFETGLKMIYRNNLIWFILTIYIFNIFTNRMLFHRSEDSWCISMLFKAVNLQILFICACYFASRTFKPLDSRIVQQFMALQWRLPCEFHIADRAHKLSKWNRFIIAWKSNNLHKIKLTGCVTVSWTISFVCSGEFLAIVPEIAIVASDWTSRSFSNVKYQIS